VFKAHSVYVECTEKYDTEIDNKRQYLKMCHSSNRHIWEQHQGIRIAYTNE
jgi:hypothetical protein